MAADRREELLNTRDDLAKHRDGAGERAFQYMPWSAPSTSSTCGESLRTSTPSQ
jgi:hypothetical protein